MSDEERPIFDKIYVTSAKTQGTDDFSTQDQASEPAIDESAKPKDLTSGSTIQITTRMPFQATLSQTSERDDESDLASSSYAARKPHRIIIRARVSE